MSEFEPGDRSVNDLWTAFMEWLDDQGDVVQVQTTHEEARKFAGTFNLAGEIILLTWVAIPRSTRSRRVLDVVDIGDVELDRRAGIVDRWEEEP